ncbi:MAG TPA: energy transducer TonB [Bryobacteraceae bacterium]|nr:energy transducer TonB [Bryobacteraceae bacterium]
MQKRSALLSLILHATFIALLLLTFVPASHMHPRREPAHVIMPLYAPDLRAEAGGGSRSPLPATQGIAPRRVAKAFIAPVVIPRTEPPLLPLEPSLEALPDLKLPEIHIAQYGDPFARLGAPSGGSRGPAGAGGEGCCGIGPGNGPNVGGVRSGRSEPHRRISSPKLVYMVEPEYSDEARKSRYQGTVILKIVVDTAGRAREVRIVRGLGLGLDEKAIEAVGHWRFDPGRQDGKPIPTSAIVEVNFHLL